MFFPTSVETQESDQSKSVSPSPQVPEVYVFHPMKGCKYEFNCCLHAVNIMSSGRRATAAQFRIKQVHHLSLFIWLDLFKTAIYIKYDNWCIVHLVFSSKTPLPPSCILTHLVPSSPCLFFYSEAGDERSRWFVLWLVSAPLSPLSDHLHLLLSNATRLWSCAHTGRQHMPETDSVQNMSLLKLQLKQTSK